MAISLDLLRVAFPACAACLDACLCRACLRADTHRQARQTGGRQAPRPRRGDSFTASRLAGAVVPAVEFKKVSSGSQRGMWQCGNDNRAPVFHFHLSSHAPRGRGTRCRVPPAQIPACSFPAPGSSLLLTRSHDPCVRHAPSLYRGYRLHGLFGRSYRPCRHSTRRNSAVPFPMCAALLRSKYYWTVGLP